MEQQTRIGPLRVDRCCSIDNNNPITDAKPNTSADAVAHTSTIYTAILFAVSDSVEHALCQAELSADCYGPNAAAEHI